MKSQNDLGGCPVIHTDYRVDRPIMEHFAMLDADREAERIYWSDLTERGFWVLNRHEDVLEACQMNEVFSNEQINAFDPNLPPGYFLPQQLDQPQHSKYRRMLNPYFSPAAVKRMLPLANERAQVLSQEIAERGACQYMTEFAIRYPTELFMELLGLPVEDGLTFMPWNEAIFNGFFDTSDQAAAARDDALVSINAYFEQMIDDRTKNPRDADTDMVTRLLEAEIDGKKLPREEVLSLCFTINLAGLDTTKSALGYITYHLARDSDLRRTLVANPDQWPAAVEEFIRMYGLIIEGGRVVTQDIDFHGAPMKAGDIVWLGFAAGSRDPRKFENPTEFVMGRENVNQHLGFGAGIHRCIGMHLARAEMDIALRTWHEHIPDYEISTTDPIMERGGQLTIKYLPLTWET